MWLILENKRNDDQWSIAIPLEEGELLFGRSPESSLILNDPRVSRRHFKVKIIGDMVEIEDLGSILGTYKNGVKIERDVLSDGDELRVGDSIIFVSEKPPKPEKKDRASNEALDSKALLDDRADLKHRDKDSSDASKGSKESATNWSSFQSFIETLVEATDPKNRLESLLAGLVEHVGAERGFVLTYKENDGGVNIVASHQVQKEEDFVHFSSTVYKEALKCRRVIMVPSTAASKRFQLSQSLLFFDEPRAIICAPLFIEGKPYGVLYLDRKLSSGSLDLRTLQVVESVSNLSTQVITNAKLHKEIQNKEGQLEAFQRYSNRDSDFVCGDGAASKRLNSLIEAAAPQEVTVLITGPTGTGKEVIAREVHRVSKRSKGPFIAVNCAALSTGVIESELFGAEKGAFTGCDTQRRGYFEAAHEGTLFLDEIAEIPKELQVKLLRVLQERNIVRVGRTKAVPIDFRLIGATNVNLEDAVRDGDFREDLYYRLNVFRLQLLPLRSRKEDILPLARHFLHTISKLTGKTFKGLTKDAEEALLAHPWPGNVRELRNAIERAVVVERESQIGVDSLPIAKAEKVDCSDHQSEEFWKSLPQDFDSACAYFQQILLERALDASDGNASAAARSLGISRSTLYRYMRRLSLNKE